MEQGPQFTRKSLSEACAEDLGIEIEHLWEQAQDRTAWRMLVEGLRENLEPTARYVPVSIKKREIEQILLSNASAMEKWETLQFFEEGSTLWPDYGLLHMYCDGSSQRKFNQIVAGAAVAVAQNGYVAFSKKQSLQKADATSIRSELHAFFLALQIGEGKQESFVVHVDSEYVWNFWHKVRVPYQLGKYADWENADLLERISSLARSILKKYKIFVVKVRAHSGNFMNELVDKLANEAAVELVREPVNPSTTACRVINSTAECGHKFRDKASCLHSCCKRHLGVAKDNINISLS